MGTGAPETGLDVERYPVRSRSEIRDTMLTFVHLSELEEIEKFCRDDLLINDIVHSKKHFNALEDHLSVGRGQKEMGKLPTVALRGSTSPEHRQKFLALKKKFGVSTKVVVAEFLGVK